MNHDNSFIHSFISILEVRGHLLAASSTLDFIGHRTVALLQFETEAVTFCISSHLTDTKLRLESTDAFEKFWTWRTRRGFCQ